MLHEILFFYMVMNNKKEEIIEEVACEVVPPHEEISPFEDTKKSITEEATLIPPKKSLLEKIIVGILLGLVFLIPIFFLPIDGISSAFAKNIFLSFTVIFAFILALFLWMKQEIVVLPKSPIFAALFFLIAVYAFSSFISGSFSNSFFGAGEEIITSVTLLVLGILLFLFAVFFRTKERVFYAFVAFFISSIFVFLFQIFHFIFPDLTVFAGIPSVKTANLIGRWSDLGIFSGIIAILALVTIEKMPYIGKVIRGALYVFLAVALFFYGIIFYSNSWAILGAVTLAISIFIFFHTAHVQAENISITKKWLLTPSFIVAMFSLLLVFVGTPVNTKLFEVFNIPPVQDVRPSWAGTYQVSRGLFEEGTRDAIFGVGPNRFFIPWQKYRPSEVNYTPWWGVDFNEGIGTIPSSLVSTGIVGFSAWIFFLISFFFGGLFAFKKKFGQMDEIMQYVSTASFASASYCWIAIFLNTVGVVPFVFAFVFTGLFLGVLSASGSPQVRDYNYLKNPQKGFTSVVILLLLLGLSGGLGYVTLQRTRSFFAYQDALSAGENGNLEKADMEFKKAINLASSDAYYRSFSTLNSYRAQQLISRTDLSPDDLRAQFGMNFQASIDTAQKAIAIDDANYLNWVTLGNAYSLLIPLNIKDVSDDAYVRAKKAYEEAVKLNPHNPQILYMLAHVAMSKNQPDEAISYAKRALALKSDYSDALIFLSQIEEGRGNLKAALAIMEESYAFNFSDPLILFRLGYLRYKNGAYETAVAAFEKAIRMIPDYSNAKYFLGLSYFEIGRTSDAIKEFKDIESLNPGRTDILQIINNLHNGYAPLSLTAPEDTSSLSTSTAPTTDSE